MAPDHSTVSAAPVHMKEWTGQRNEHVDSLTALLGKPAVDGLTSGSTYDVQPGGKPLLSTTTIKCFLEETCHVYLPLSTERKAISGETTKNATNK